MMRNGYCNRQIEVTIIHTIIIINLFAICSYQIADIYHAMAGHQKHKVQLADGICRH